MKRRGFLELLGLSALEATVPRRAYSFIWTPPPRKLLQPADLYIVAGSPLERAFHEYLFPNLRFRA